MVKIRQAIVVEGRYDKNTLSQIVDATILETSGFGIMRDKQQLSLLRRVAQSRGLIVFTDSDGAGFVIRNFLKSAIEPEFLLHAYIPDVYGKEKRKQTAGKEGKLGVEGMPPDVILECLRRAGAQFEDEQPVTVSQPITKQNLMELGLSGGKDSSQRRAQLLQRLEFPQHMSSNAMLQALNLLYTLPQLQEIMKNL